MTKSHLLNLISNYTSSFEEESIFKLKFLELLKDSDCFLRSRLAGHLTASCWVTNSSYSKVLLLHHAKLNKWLQPGGHADGDEDLINVAQKELQEETGLVQVRIFNDQIFDLDIHLIPLKKDIPEHFHFDVRFQFITDNINDIKKNHESIDLKWVNLEEVQDLCENEKSIMRMVEKTILIKQNTKTA